MVISTDLPDTTIDMLNLIMDCPHHPLLIRLYTCGYQLRKRGGDFEWKKLELLRRVRLGRHSSLLLKDGSAAGMVIIDEAQVGLPPRINDWCCKHLCGG